MLPASAPIREKDQQVRSREQQCAGGHAAARELADKIKTRKLGPDNFFSCRKVYLKGWSALDTPEAVKQAAEVLQDAGWVRDMSGGSGPSGGRPSNKYAINPGDYGPVNQDGEEH